MTPRIIRAVVRSSRASTVHPRATDAMHAAAGNAHRVQLRSSQQHTPCQQSGNMFGPLRPHPREAVPRRECASLGPASGSERQGCSLRRGTHLAILGLIHGTPEHAYRISVPVHRHATCSAIRLSAMYAHEDVCATHAPCHIQRWRARAWDHPMQCS